MEIADSSATFVNVYKTTRCRIPEGSIFYVPYPIDVDNSKNILFDGASETGWSRDNNLDLYSGGTLFETLPGHRVS
jgi:hypothetical protein